MEYWVPKSDSSVSLSLESIGDSETDLLIDTDMVSDAFVRNATIPDYDDDAESTSGDDSVAKDGNVGQDMRRQKLCIEWWYDLCDAKQILDDGEIIEAQRERNSVVLEAQEETVVAGDDAESNRQFWDACLAHGY